MAGKANVGQPAKVQERRTYRGPVIGKDRWTFDKLIDRADEIDAMLSDGETAVRVADKAIQNHRGRIETFKLWLRHMSLKPNGN